MLLGEADLALPPEIMATNLDLIIVRNIVSLMSVSFTCVLKHTNNCSMELGWHCVCNLEASPYAGFDHT